MKINSIQKKNEDTVLLQFDNGEFLYLTYDTFLSNGLRINKEISEEEHKQLIDENRLFYIRKKAFSLLARRKHAEKELRMKLYNKEYSKELIDIVISDLKERDYINDFEFAQLYVEENIRRKMWGKNKVNSELMKKGVSGDIIKKIDEIYFADEDHSDAIHRLCEKKYNLLKHKKLEPRQLKDKIISFLLSKGYDYSNSINSVNSFLKNMNQELEEDVE
ncbi:MAG TPA: regulatory protein RecX [Ignavibacteriaceae bacterium]|nr:regulatory protein RecX [Ignavibacteriaceae bacterium]